MMINLFTATTTAEVVELVRRGYNIEEEREETINAETYSERRVCTPLISSIKRRRRPVFFALLNSGAEPNHNPPRCPMPIQEAAAEGMADMVGSLINRGANINENEGGFGTPLQIAAWYGHEATAEALLTLGAEKETRDEENRTALNIAFERGHQGVASQLLRFGAKIEPGRNERRLVEQACGHGHQGLLEELVNYNIDLLFVDAYGQTLIFLAALSREPCLVGYLVDLGADINHRDNNNMTALMYASQKGRPDSVRILLGLGAETQIKDNEGQKAIDLTHSQEIRDLLQVYEPLPPDPATFEEEEEPLLLGNRF